MLNILPSHHITNKNQWHGRHQIFMRCLKHNQIFYLKHQVLCSGSECPVCGEPIRFEDWDSSLYCSLGSQVSEPWYT